MSHQLHIFLKNLNVTTTFFSLLLIFIKGDLMYNLGKIQVIFSIKLAGKQSSLQ